MGIMPYTTKQNNEILSVLYLNFDSVYTRLYDIDPTIAIAFATSPIRWLKWIEGHALKILYGDSYKRRILKKVCYINSYKYVEARHCFVRAGFTIRDCIPLQGVEHSPIDTQFIIDCIHDNIHHTYYDEFILLLSDKDVSPLLVYLHEHTKRTLVLGLGTHAHSCNSSATWKIREDWFIKQAILEDVLQPSPPILEEPDMNKIPNINLDLHKKIAQYIINLVEEAHAPLSIANIAHALQDKFNATEEWFGFGKLKAFLDILPLEGLEFSAVPPGYIYNPQKHDIPEQISFAKELEINYPQLFILAEEIHDLTDIPLLPPAYYASLIINFVEELKQNSFFMTTTSRNVRNTCMEQGFSIARSHVNFLIVGLSKANFSFSDIESLTPQYIVDTFTSTLQMICEEKKRVFSPEEIDMLKQWFLGTYKE